METTTKYYVKYKINHAGPFRYNLSGIKTYVIECNSKKDAMIHGNVMNYDNIKKIEIYSKTYARVLNVRIPIKKTSIFTSNKKDLKR